MNLRPWMSYSHYRLRRCDPYTYGTHSRQTRVQLQAIKQILEDNLLLQNDTIKRCSERSMMYGLTNGGCASIAPKTCGRLPTLFFKNLSIVKINWDRVKV